MTTHQGLRLATGVVVENMGTTALVLVPGQQDVLTLTGPAADVVRAVIAGHPISLELEEAADHLIAAGVLTSPVSRRTLIRAGAIATGAGIAVLSMPSVAAASSPTPTPDPDPDPDPDPGGGGLPAFSLTSVTESGTSGNVGDLTITLPDLPGWSAPTGTNSFGDLSFSFAGTNYVIEVFSSGGLVFNLGGFLEGGAAPLAAFQAGSGVTVTFTGKGAFTPGVAVLTL